MSAAPAVKRSKKEEEDVCFICFDGGKLVLCDRRDCPKAYHPACVKRDESFFRRRVRWNCGWHLCNICQRNALFMCYTCPYSLCKACVKQADILCVRGKKGFCRTCMSSVSLIENISQGSKDTCHVDFDDTTSWEYLFKVYWNFLKQKESLTLEELTRATNPWKGQMLNYKNVYSGGVYNVSVNTTVESSGSTIQLASNGCHVEVNGSKRRKTRKHSALQISSQEKVTGKLHFGVADWASKELLEFVAHMKNGDTSTLSQFDVQALLLEYIKRKSLCDPHQKSHIICDWRLETLFGKAQVGQFEMLKLLGHHFKEGSHQNGVVHGAAVDSSVCQLEAEWCDEDTCTTNRRKKRPARKKADERGRQINLHNYAAIDVHNINLIFLKRNLMENLMDDAEKFHDNVVGSVVRIRIYGNDLKQDMYRLVRVVGTSKAAEPYKIGDRTAHIMLKILNLDKIEDVAIDVISNQDFSEDECRCLRQSIKCGLAERMTVGDLQKKAIALQAMRVNDVLEAEILKINHLRDRASEIGHRKELRECIEKLELLKSPEEHKWRVREIPEVHADPRMDPSYRSDEDSKQLDPKQRDLNTATKSSNSNSMPMELITPMRGGDPPYGVRAKVVESSSFHQEQTRSMSIRSQSSKEDTPPKSCESTPSSLELEKDAARILEELSKQVDPCHLTKHEPETSANNPSHQVASSDASVTSSSTAFSLSSEHSELERLWHYQDPSGKVQGPFCMLQLRRWNSSGYFPSDLKIWKINESQDSSVLLNETLSMHWHSSDCQLQSNNSSFGSEDAKVTSDSRNTEHDQQMNSNMNLESKGHKRNEGCDSDMTDGAACSGDEKKAVDEENNGKGENLHCTEIASEENQKSPSAECSLAKEEVVGQSVISSTAGPFAAMDHSHKHEASNLTGPMPKDGNEDLKSLQMENEQVSASTVSGKNPGSSSWSPSSSRLELPDLQNSRLKPKDDDSKEGEAENKGNNIDLKNEPTKDKQPPESSAAPERKQPPESSVAPERNLCTDWNDPPDQSKLGFSDLPNQMQKLDNKDMNSLTEEVKPSIASDMPGQDSSTTSWNPISGEIEFSIPVSSAIHGNEDMKGGASMGHCVTSAVPCQNVGVSWSAASTLVACGPVPVSREWVGYSHMHAKPCEDLDAGLGPGPSIKFGEPSNEHETTAGWHDGPIELATLGDESVSDLLSEVEALESMNGGMTSNSRINCGDGSIDSPSNDCFGPLVGLSPTLDHGKSDAWSSTCAVQFHSQPTTTGELHHHHTVFGLNIHGFSTRISDPCSSSSPCTEGRSEMKPGFVSSHDQDFPLGHAPPLPLPSLNLFLSSRGLESEGDAKQSPMHMQDLGSQGLLTVSLPLPTSEGPTVSPISKGDLKPADVSTNHQDFVSLDQAPPPPSSGKSVNISLSPEEKAVVTPAYVSMSRKELVAQADLLPLPQSPSQPPSPIMSRLDSSSPIREEMKQREVSQVEGSPSPPPLPRLPPLPALLPPLSSSPSTSRMDSSGPKEEAEMKQPDASFNHKELVPLVHALSPLPPSPQPSPPHPPSPQSPPPPPPPPPSTTLDTTLSLSEEGELEPVSSFSSVEQPGQGPCPESLPPPPPPLPQFRELKTSIPEEEKDEPPSHLANKQQNNKPTAQSSSAQPSTGVLSVKRPSFDTLSMNTATGRAVVREDSDFSPTGSSLRNTKSTTSQAGRGNSVTTSNGHSNLYRGTAIYHVAAYHQGNNRASQQQVRYQGVLGRPSGPKDRSYHHYHHQHQGTVSGFAKPNRHSWNRPSSSFGSGVGGGLSWQPLPGHNRGKGVCKFYESGYCKKGASCNYLHPL